MADDSLGWVYQVWQAERKDQINESGAKIGADELPAVTQLFTEDYMNTRGGTIVVGALNLGGSIEALPNAVRIAELAVDKQAQTLLMPVAARRQLNELPDDMWTRVNVEFYKDSADAVFKALID